MLRVDIDKKIFPDVLVKDYKLPFKDGELDFISGIHSFEHSLIRIKRWQNGLE